VNFIFTETFLRRVFDDKIVGELVFVDNMPEASNEDAIALVNCGIEVAKIEPDARIKFVEYFETTKDWKHPVRRVIGLLIAQIGFWPVHTEVKMLKDVEATYQSNSVNPIFTGTFNQVQGLKTHL
jgi:hypothetical protein